MQCLLAKCKQSTVRQVETVKVCKACAAGKMAVLDIGAATAEQLQSLKQHPALKQAFTVYVSRQAALKASLAATGVPGATAEQTLANIAATQEAMAATDELVQVSLLASFV